MSSSERTASSLYPIAYALAALFFLLPLIELVLTVWPWRPGTLLWRFGSFGLLVQTLMLPTFGMFIALLTASILGHRRFQLVLSVFVLLFVVGLLASTGLFLLDGLQTRASARPDLRGSVTAAAARAAGAATLYGVVWIWMGIAAFRSARVHVRADRKRSHASLLNRPTAPVPAQRGPGAPPAP